MSFGTLFWVIMILWALFAVAWHQNWGQAGAWGPAGNSFLLFVLFALLGWRVFGPVLHG